MAFRRSFRLPSESAERVEGRIAYLEDRPEDDNPYLTQKERAKLKEQWNQKAQDWDNGWIEAKIQGDKDEAVWD